MNKELYNTPNNMNTTVGDLILRPLETVLNTVSAREAAKIMNDKDISSLLVTDSKSQPLGIITERDIVRKVFAREHEDINAIMSRDIISSPLITANSKSPAGLVGELFLKNNVRHLFVLENKDGIDRPLGIITPLDFIWYREEFRKVRLENRDEEIETMLEYYRYLH